MEVLADAEPERIAALRSRGEFFWLDLCHPEQPELEALGELLGLHPLAIEDTREWGQRPKADAYEDFLFLVFYSAVVDGAELRPLEVHVFVAGDYVVTARREACPQLDALRADPEGARHDDAEDAIVHRILDALADGYFPVIAEIERRVDALETAVFERTRDTQLEEIYRLRQDVRAVGRRVLIQRDGFPAASEALLAQPGLEHGTGAYLRDVGDHLAQAAGELHRQIDDLTALTDTFFNANANRLNVLATRLSVVATFFLVWTLVTGFFGQNFGWLVDGIKSQTDFLVLEGASLVLPTVLLAIYFWRRRADWF